MNEAQRKDFFNTHENNIDPIDGYPERNVAWFKEHILPDFLKVKKRLNLGPKLLDVGCAFGYFTKILGEHFDGVVGIDFAEMRIEGAKLYNAAPNVSFHVVDLTKQQPPKHCNDAISSAVFQHIAPDQRRQAFENVFNVLPSGARLVLYDENFYYRKDKWNGFYEPLSPHWLDENLLDIAMLTNYEYLCRGQHGEYIFRYELKKRV